MIGVTVIASRRLDRDRRLGGYVHIEVYAWKAYFPFIIVQLCHEGGVARSETTL